MGFLMNRLIAVPLVLATALLTGCAALILTRPLEPTEEDWAMSGATPERSSSCRGALVPPLELAWDVGIGAGIGYGSPVTADSLLLVATLKGEIHVIHCFTGKYRGSLNAGAPIAGSPVLASGAVIVGLSSPDESLVAYDLYLKSVRWKRSYGDIEASVLLYEGLLYAGTLRGTLECVEPSTGNSVWSFALPNNVALKGIRSAPAGSDSAVVFGADDGALYALRARDGRLLWRVQSDAPVQSPVAIDGGRVYSGNLRGTVRCVDLQSGAVRWEQRTGAPVYAGAVISGGAAFLGTIDGTVCAFDAEDGTLRWKSAVGGPVNATPVVSGEYLYLGTLKKELLALRTSSGECVWKTALGGRVKTAPAVAYDRLFVATDDRSMLAFREGPR